MTAKKAHPPHDSAATGRRTRRRFVGVISDTHGLLRPQACAALAGARLILHAGDVGGPQVLRGLAELAPVIAVRGNNDRGAWAATLPAQALVVVGDLRIVIVHERPRRPPAGLIDLLVSGHSHRPHYERLGEIEYLNPGSAGPRRFSLPVSVARLWLGDSPRVELVALEI
jgi:putative phosphoesterase